MRPDGSLNPCVEQFRKYKSTELSFLGTRRWVIDCNFSGSF
jgi:hypothetical protein